MKKRILTPERLVAYGRYLCAEERAPATVEKYLRDVGAFAAWLDGRPVTKGPPPNGRSTSWPKTTRPPL